MTDKLESLREYVQTIKPYHTKVVKLAAELAKREPCNTIIRDAIATKIKAFYGDIEEYGVTLPIPIIAYSEKYHGIYVSGNATNMLVRNEYIDIRWSKGANGTHKVLGWEYVSDGDYTKVQLFPNVKNELSDIFNIVSIINEYNDNNGIIVIQGNDIALLEGIESILVEATAQHNGIYKILYLEPFGTEHIGIHVDHLFEITEMMADGRVMKNSRGGMIFSHCKNYGALEQDVEVVVPFDYPYSISVFDKIIYKEWLSPCYDSTLHSGGYDIPAYDILPYDINVGGDFVCALHEVVWVNNTNANILAIRGNYTEKFVAGAIIRYCGMIDTNDGNYLVVRSEYDAQADETVLVLAQMLVSDCSSGYCGHIYLDYDNNNLCLNNIHEARLLGFVDDSVQFIEEAPHLSIIYRYDIVLSDPTGLDPTQEYQFIISIGDETILRSISGAICQTFNDLIATIMAKIPQLTITIDHNMLIIEYNGGRDGSIIPRNLSLLTNTNNISISYPVNSINKYRTIPDDKVWYDGNRVYISGDMRNELGFLEYVEINTNDGGLSYYTINPTHYPTVNDVSSVLPVGQHTITTSDDLTFLVKFDYVGVVCFEKVYWFTINSVIYENGMTTLTVLEDITEMEASAPSSIMSVFHSPSKNGSFLLVEDVIADYSTDFTYKRF